MKAMKRLSILSINAAAMVLAMASSAWAASPYAGEWSGTFTVEGIGKINDKGDTIPDQNGTLKIKFAEDGAITGTCDNKVLKQEGKLTGKVTDDGEISVTVKYPDQDASTVSGSVTNPKEGKVKGTLTQKIEKATVVLKIDLKK